MSSRFDANDEPAYSRNYNWRLSTEPELDALEKLDAAQKSLRDREISGGSRSKSPVTFARSIPLTRSVDLLSSSVGYDIQTKETQNKYERPKSPGFDLTENQAYGTAKSVSRTETPSGYRNSNISSNEFSRSLDLGHFISFPSSAAYHQKSRPKTAAGREGNDRIKSRPPIAPGRPKSSETLPKSGKHSTFSTANSKVTTEQDSSLNNSKRALHSSITSLDGLKYVDKHRLFEKVSKYGTVPTSGTNLGRPSSRNSDVACFSHDQLGSGIGSLGERNSPANALKSLLESRPRSALTGSLASLERSRTPVTVRKNLARTLDFENRSKSSSTRHSTDLNLRASYDDIIHRLREMDTLTSSDNLRMKSEVASNHKNLDSEKVKGSSAYAISSAFGKKSTDEFLSNRASDQFIETDVMKDSLKYGMSSTRSKDIFQYKDERKPRSSEKATEILDKFDTRIDLSSRTGERMSAYSKDGAIERWLMSVTSETSDLSDTRLHDDGSAFQDKNVSSQDRLEYSQIAKNKTPLKVVESSNGYDNKASNERSRMLLSDSYEKVTSPRKQLLEKSTLFSTDSVYDANKPIHTTGKGYEPDLLLAKLGRDRSSSYLNSYDPNARSDSRLSLLRKCLDQADNIGTQSVSSAVDRGYLKLPEELELDDLRRSRSSFDDRNFKINTSQPNGSPSRKTSSDFSNLGNSAKPAGIVTTRTRTSSVEALYNEDPYDGISLSRNRLDSYQKSSSGLRYEDQTSHSGRSFQNSNTGSFNALTSSTERPRSPIRSFGETSGEKEHGIAVRKGEITGFELDRESEKARKDDVYTATSSYYNNTSSHSSLGQNWKSRSYGNSAAGDTGQAGEKKPDGGDFQLTDKRADSRTLLSILENNRKYKMASTGDQSQMTEGNYSSRTPRELSDKAESGLTSTTDAVSRYDKDKMQLATEPHRNRSFETFSSLVPPKRVWYSEEHLASSTGDVGNDISVKFDYKPNTFRYVLRKDVGESESDRVSASNGVTESSAAGVGARRWRSDLALFRDDPDNEDPPAATSGTRHSGLSVLRSSSFRGATEGKTPERRQVTWQDEVVQKKDNCDSTFVRSDKTNWHVDVVSGKESVASPSALSFTSAFDRIHHIDRNSIARDLTSPTESSLFYQSLRSGSPSSKSFFTSAWHASGTDENRHTGLTETVAGESKSRLFQETPSNYRPSHRLTSTTYNDREPYSTKMSSATLYDDHNLISTANQPSGQVKQPSEDHSTYRRHTPTDDGVFSKSSKYLPSDSVFKSPDSPTRYTSTALSIPSHADGSPTRYTSTAHSSPSHADGSPTRYTSTALSSPSHADDSPTRYTSTAHSSPSHADDSPTRYTSTALSSPSHADGSPTRYTSTALSSPSHADDSPRRYTSTAHSSPSHADGSPTRYASTALSSPSHADDSPTRYMSSALSSPSHADDAPTRYTSTALSSPSHADGSPTRYTSTALSNPSHADDAPTRYTSTAFSSPSHADDHTGNFVTSNSALKTEKGQPSSLHSVLRSTEFLSSESYDKSTDGAHNDNILQNTRRPLVYNGALSSVNTDSYSRPLSSSVYEWSTHKDFSHITPTSLANLSGREVSPTQGFVSPANLPQCDNASLLLNQASNFTHDSRHKTTSLIKSADAFTKDYSSVGLPYKYLCYTNRVPSSSSCSNGDTSRKLPTSLSHPYSEIGRHVSLTSSRSASRDDLRHQGSDSLANGFSFGVDTPSAVADKHDDGMSLVSETEFVVMRSGDIVKRPFKKSGKTDVNIQSRYS